MSTRVLVTGANGFVGKALCGALIGRYQVRGAVRNLGEGSSLDGVEEVSGCLSADFDWTNALVGVSVLVHCAARVHVMNEESSDPLTEFRRVNVEGTLHLARQAAAAGVRRFLFISSIGVNGGETFGLPFFSNSELAPHSPYALSKYEAEIGLRKLAANTGMEVVVIRPPLVYGPNAPGNFANLMKWLFFGIPLPFGGITENKRSFVFLDNLLDLIMTCLDHPAAANQTFLVSDGESLSTTELLRLIGVALRRSVWLIPIPVSVLRFGASLLGKPAMAQRLCGSLEVDISKARELLGWVPPFSVDEGLRRTAEHWIMTHQTSHGKI